MPIPARPEDVTVVLPAYRLGDSIAANITTVAEVLPAADIVVVDDGSDDDTFEQAEKVAARLSQLRVIRHPRNRGKGAALQTGTAAAAGTIVVFLDGDLDLPAEQLPELLDHFARSGADVLVGAKQTVMSGGRYPWKRRVLSRVFSQVTRILFSLPVDETQTGLKVFRRAVLDEVMADLRIFRYAFDLELLVRAHQAGYRLVQVPVKLRVGASSAPLSFRTLWEMARDTLRIFLWSRRRGA